MIFLRMRCINLIIFQSFYTLLLPVDVAITKVTMNVMNLGLNDWVTCPFDPVHQLKYSRFYNHFVECRKKHPEDRRKQCPYNFSEMIEPEEYENHLKECPYQSLYFNVGQVNHMPEYDAPSHFNIDENQKPVSARRLDTFSDWEDEEFDSVSVAANRDNYRRYFNEPPPPQAFQPRPVARDDSPPPLRLKLKPANDASETSAGPRRGMGRGAWIRRMLEERRSEPESSASGRSEDESTVAPEDSSSSGLSISDHNDELIEHFRNDPFSIAKEFGRGRGAIFKTLLRD